MINKDDKCKTCVTMKSKRFSWYCIGCKENYYSNYRQATATGRLTSGDLCKDAVMREGITLKVPVPMKRKIERLSKSGRMSTTAYIIRLIDAHLRELGE
jgi:NAD-dependent SIR2 family protein deacetylase